MKAFIVNDKTEIWNQIQYPNSLMFSSNTWLLLVCTWELCITKDKLPKSSAFLFDLCIEREDGKDYLGTLPFVIVYKV